MGVLILLRSFAHQLFLMSRVVPPLIVQIVQGVVLDALHVRLVAEVSVVLQVFGEVRIQTYAQGVNGGNKGSVAVALPN